MSAKVLFSFLALLALLPDQSVAAAKPTSEVPMTNWHWTHSFTTYGNDPHFRSWYTLQGIVRFAVHNGQFEVVIGEPKDGTDTLVRGRIRGRQVTATVFVVQTDEPPRTYRGTFDEDDGAKRISLVSPDGRFIGFITQAPPGSEANN